NAKFIFIWTAFCTATALAVTSVGAPHESGSFLRLLGRNLLSTHAIGFGALFAGHWAWRKWLSVRIRERYFLVVSFSILGGLSGRSLLIPAFHFTGWFDWSDFLSPFGYAATLFITFMVSSATFIIWSLQKNSATLFPFRTGRSERRYVPLEEIIYLTAEGKKTVLHTSEGDQSTSELMKEILSRLPEERFLRIHKKYAVQLACISRIQHLRSGHYAVFLRGEEYIVPASSRFARELRRRLAG
ncbi:MAG: LytTR family transcriptional regulator, partial [Spirochaetia bacterium]|nr:LytTR family transcriptional regulator [Spirochaetia bacterium]